MRPVKVTIFILLLTACGVLTACGGETEQSSEESVDNSKAAEGHLFDAQTDALKKAEGIEESVIEADQKRQQALKEL